MKKKIFGLIGSIAIIALMVFNTQFTYNANGGSLALSSLVMQAFADGEGNGPACCGVVCCDYQSMLFPPTHIRCEIICVPQHFCIATGGSSILCDFQYVSCGEYCADFCAGA
jgi:hypothetical protein